MFFFSVTVFLFLGLIFFGNLKGSVFAEDACSASMFFGSSAWGLVSGACRGRADKEESGRG